MAAIHPTAVVAGDVELGDGVEVGPYAVIRAEIGPVVLGDGVRIGSHVVIDGPVRIGAGTRVGPFSVVGGWAQDLKCKPGSPTAGCVIGEECDLREHTTVHNATKADVPTVIGNRVMMMVGAHVGHDCVVGDRCIMVNGTALGGHVTVGSDVNIGGGTMVHQFCRIGRMAMVGGGSVIVSEVPPFFKTFGLSVAIGINTVGLRRNGVANPEITALRRVYRQLWVPRVPRREAIARMDAEREAFPLLGEVADFLRAAKRPVVLHASRRDDDPDAEA